MEDKRTLWLGFFLIYLGGVFFGYVFAHGEVARECERLGGFYVGNSTYQCKLKGA